MAVKAGQTILQPESVMALVTTKVKVMAAVRVMMIALAAMASMLEVEGPAASKQGRGV